MHHTEFVAMKPALFRGEMNLFTTPAPFFSQARQTLNSKPHKLLAGYSITSSTCIRRVEKAAWQDAGFSLWK